MTLVCAEDLRIDVDGVPVCDGLSFSTRAENELLLGAPRALFEALAGLRPIARGTLRILGTDAPGAVREGIVASAALDPPLPPKWTAIEYVTWSARLVGHRASDARALAAEAISRVQLDTLSTLPLARLVVHARRAVVVAAALATDAAVMLVEDPLADLPEEAARTWARILVQALDGRPWVVVAGRVALTSPLAMNAEEAIVISSSRAIAQGPPAEIVAHEDRRFALRIHGPLDAFGASVTARGARMDVQGAHVLLDLGESVTTADILGMAAESHVTIVEMVPVARALG